MLESIAGDICKRDSCGILLILELFFVGDVIVYPSVKLATLVRMSDIKFDSISCLVAFHITNFRPLSNGDFRRHGFFVFDVMFVFTVIRTLKPDIKIVFCRINFDILEFYSILALFCNKGLMFICLAPYRHQTVLPVGDIKGNNYIVLCFLTSHLLGLNLNIAYYGSKGRLVWDAQLAVFCCISCPNTIGVIFFSVGKQSRYIDRHIALFGLCTRIRIVNLYRGTAIDARIEF